MTDYDAPDYDGDISTVIDEHEKWLNNEGGERANLRHANLRDANLRHADLRHDDLRHADLRDANLRDANLRDANLRHANLRHADLRDANLGAHEIIPESGAFEAYKATQNHIVRIRIPADAERLTALTSRKCRAEYVETLEVLDENGEPCDETEARGKYDGETSYVEGEITKADEWDDDPRVECSNGIHFFVTKQEAREWL